MMSVPQNFEVCEMTRAKHAAPASRTQPVKAWAAISEDVPPEIYEIGFHRQWFHRQDLRHIPVMVVPDIKRKSPRKNRKG
jgi:hypothetical protein